MFEVVDKIEDWLFGTEATVSPGGWSCNSCAAPVEGDNPCAPYRCGANQSPIIDD